jgi:epoxyqueuosine reductase QueG
MSFEAELEDLGRAWGADLFGIADLAPAREFVVAQGGSLVAEFPRAISVGVVLLHSIVDQLPRRAERTVATTYRLHGYEAINQRLDLITSRLSSHLQRAGHRALPVPASVRTDDERLCGLFSHKLAAHLAGLGWIGKSCMVITPQAGPRARWGTVLTDAPLAPGGSPQAERCGECRQCVDACPVGAFTGQPFRPEEPRETRFDAHKCRRYFNEMWENHPWAVCGMCLYACPYGQRSSRGLR